MSITNLHAGLTKLSQVKNDFKNADHAISIATSVKNDVSNLISDFNNHKSVIVEIQDGIKTITDTLNVFGKQDELNTIKTDVSNLRSEFEANIEEISNAFESYITNATPRLSTDKITEHGIKLDDHEVQLNDHEDRLIDLENTIKTLKQVPIPQLVPPINMIKTASDIEATQLQPTIIFKKPSKPFPKTVKNKV